jgi:hypothetical protein
VSDLNGEKLTPFHVAAKHGNLEAVKYFVDEQHHHPSKSAENGQTPLQLAVAAVTTAGDKDTAVQLVKFLVKPSPVHDVSRCWTTIENETVTADEKMLQTWMKVKDALLTKVRAKDAPRTHTFSSHSTLEWLCSP